VPVEGFGGGWNVGRGLVVGCWSGAGGWVEPGWGDEAAEAVAEHEGAGFGAALDAELPQVQGPVVVGAD